MGLQKTHSKIVEGFHVRAYRDPSTISGEWVVELNGRTERFNARKWTLKESIEYAVDFEKSKRERQMAEQSDYDISGLSSERRAT